MRGIYIYIDGYNGCFIDCYNLYWLFLNIGCFIVCYIMMEADKAWVSEGFISWTVGLIVIL